jgi:hypothetical protein
VRCYEAKFRTTTAFVRANPIAHLGDDAAYLTIEGWSRNTKWWPDRFDWYLMYEPFEAADARSVRTCLSLLVRASTIEKASPTEG